VRGNVDHLLPLTALAIAKGFSKINFQFTTPFGRAWEDVVPPLDEAARAVMRVIDRYADQIKIYVINAQLCAFPGYEQYVAGDLQKLGRTMIFAADPRFPEQVNLHDWLGAKREKREVCHTCPWTTVCEGFQVFVQEKPGHARRARAAGGGGGRRMTAVKLKDQWCEYEDVLVDVMIGYACNVQCDYCSITDEMRRENMLTAGDHGQSCATRARAAPPRSPSAAASRPSAAACCRWCAGAATAAGPRSRCRRTRCCTRTPTTAKEASEAGITTFHISFMAHTPELYAQIMGRPDAMALATQGLNHLIALGHKPIGDLIIKSDTWMHLPDIVEHWARLGVEKFNLWLVSLSDRNQHNLASLLPVSEMRDGIVGAFQRGKQLGVTVLSRHIPRCMLYGYEEHIADLRDDNGPGDQRPRTVVRAVGGRASRRTPTRQVHGCRHHKGVCLGARQDYLERYGDTSCAGYARAKRSLIRVSCRRQGRERRLPLGWRLAAVSMQASIRAENSFPGRSVRVRRAMTHSHLKSFDRPRRRRCPVARHRLPARRAVRRGLRVSRPRLRAARPRRTALPHPPARQAGAGRGYAARHGRRVRQRAPGAGAAPARRAAEPEADRGYRQPRHLRRRRRRGARRRGGVDRPAGSG
jgi:cyclic pyranopterin phosphate synthase